MSKKPTSMCEIVEKDYNLCLARCRALLFIIISLSLFFYLFIQICNMFLVAKNVKN